MPKLITVVTICRNDIEGLRRTVDSVLKQTFSDFQYIVIDGYSNDGSDEFLSSLHESGALTLVRRHPLGIYDAMNIAFELVQGKWVNFLNSGDELFSTSTLSRVKANLLESNADVIYGRHAKTQSNGQPKIRRLGKTKSFWKGMPFSHQAAFLNFDKNCEVRFNERRILAADFEMFYLMYSKGAEFLGMDLVVAKIEAGGVSDLRRLQVLSEWEDIVSSDRFFVQVYYWVRKLREKFRKIIFLQF